MPIAVKKWGNSAAVRIPAAILVEAGLEIDQQVEIRQEHGRIVIEPLPPKQFDLRDLVDRIRPDNVHELADSGAPVGREVW